MFLQGLDNVFDLLIFGEDHVESENYGKIQKSTDFDKNRP